MVWRRSGHAALKCAATNAIPTRFWLNFRKSLIEIGDQVFHVFDADR
jgi:hypothetical protein